MRFELVNTFIAGILNIILNVSFITYLGMIGAAITTTIINIFSSVLGVWYTKRTLKRMKDN